MLRLKIVNFCFALTTSVRTMNIVYMETINHYGVQKWNYGYYELYFRHLRVKEVIVVIFSMCGIVKKLNRIEMIYLIRTVLSEDQTKM